MINPLMMVLRSPCPPVQQHAPPQAEFSTGQHYTAMSQASGVPTQHSVHYDNPQISHALRANASYPSQDLPACAPVLTYAGVGAFPDYNQANPNYAGYANGYRPWQSNSDPRMGSYNGHYSATYANQSPPYWSGTPWPYFNQQQYPV